MHTLTVRTSMRCEFVDITSEVAGVVAGSRVNSGIVTVYSPHTTAGITINENADPDVLSDMTMILELLFEEEDIDYRHMEGNSDSHVKSTLTGASETFIIEDGKLVLGTWQAIYFAEYDGPRSRKVHVKVIEG